MTLEQAIKEEQRRYVNACADGSRQAAHRHLLAIRRLRHHVVTDHEAACRATLTVHAYSDLDGYGA